MCNVINPIDVSIELTSKCNLNCIHCLQPSNRNGEPLKTTDYFRIADELVNFGVFEVFLTGGEPLLNPDWYIIGKRFIDLGFAVGLSTNGCLIDLNVAEKILNVGLYKALQVSVDGSTKEVHESMRGTGSYSSVNYGLDCLAKVGIFPNLAVAVTKLNINDVPNLVDFALFRKLRHIHIISLMPIGNKNLLYRDLDVSLDEWVDLEEKLKEKVQKVKDVLSIDWTNRRYLPRDLDLKIEDYTEIDRLFAGCPAGKTKALIDYTGDVYGCDVLKKPEFCAGNIHLDSFENIWYNSDAFNKWRKRSEDKIKGKCKMCKWLFACVGGCPAISVAYGKTIFHSDPSCPGHT
jgi:radical SAM protein with 4Fe4S-binding SPASM domain